MAVVNVLIKRPPEQVWEVLSDGYAYSQWVVGTREIRASDENWPEVGSAIHYTVGFGPLNFRGTTVVRHAEPGRQLGLEADGGPLGTARIVIDLFDWGADTVVVLDEHPLRGAAYRLHNTLSDAVLLLRGRPMVQNLARLVESRGPRWGAAARRRSFVPARSAIVRPAGPRDGQALSSSVATLRSRIPSAR